MIWYVFYRLNFESPRALKLNRGTAARAEMAARKELQEWGSGFEILYTLPGSQVCPDCRHPWYRHTPHGCEAQVVTVVEGVTMERQCHCRRWTARDAAIYPGT